MENLLGTSLVMIGGGTLLAIIVITFLLKMYRRASKEIAFVRTGVGGEKVVMNGGALVLRPSSHTFRFQRDYSKIEHSEGGVE